MPRKIILYVQKTWMAGVCASLYGGGISWLGPIDPAVRPNMTQEDTNRLQQIVAKDSENLEARRQLLRYYFYNAQGLSGCE